MSANNTTIRPYRPGDRQAVRDICAATCWMGDSRPDAIGDDWTWAEYWTRYFTDAEPQHTWVAESAEGQVCGYLTGTTDIRRFQRYMPRLLPGIGWRVLRRRLMRRRKPRRALLNLAASALRGEMDPPPGVARRFPATWHFNLLPDARGKGLGSRLFDTFRRCVVAAGVPGIHAQILSVNAAAVSFARKKGFALAARRRTGAFRHVQRGPMDIETWVLALSGAPSLRHYGLVEAARRPDNIRCATDRS